jgi:arginase
LPPLHLLGVPLDLGAGRRGVDMGPSALRLAGLAAALTRLGYAVVDRGNIPSPTQETADPGSESKRYIADIADACERLHAAVLASRAADALSVVLGGDHSLAAGSVSAAAADARRRERPFGLLWLDAHGDMNTPRTTTSGSVHGMPLAALVGPEPAELAHFGGVSPAVDPDRTVLFGVRNLDEHEKVLVSLSGVHVVTMSEIDREGVAAAAERALAIVGRDDAVLHVSLDMDVCDPSIAPGVGTPVRGGLLYREAHLVMELVAETRRLGSFDLVEINPILDVRNATAELGVELVSSALGQRIL